MLDVPSDLLDRYAGWQWEPVSVYPGRSAMQRLSSPSGETHFLKVVRQGWTPGADAEADRIEWARSYLPVPRVLDRGVTRECTWLVTEAMDGVDATSAVFRDDLPGLVRRLAEGLRSFHGAPVDACPFQFRIADALEVVRERLRTGQIDSTRDFHPEFARLTADAAVSRLVATIPDSEDLVVCHGDYCVPNILLSGNRVAGYVDLGELGVADRWWDIAVATWSLNWNFGPGYENLFLDSYGVRRDESRVQFFRLLYDLVS